MGGPRTNDVKKNVGNKKKSVKQMWSLDFGHNDNQSFMSNLVRIDEKYNFEFIKCWLYKGKYIHSRSRLLMPIRARNSVARDVLSTLKMMPAAEEYEIFLLVVAYADYISIWLHYEKVKGHCNSFISQPTYVNKSGTINKCENT